MKRDAPKLTPKKKSLQLILPRLSKRSVDPAIGAP